MTDPTYTHLLLVVDRSGSMASIRHPMNVAIDQLLEEQAALPERLLVDVWTFDDKAEQVVHRADPLAAAALGPFVKPRGATALHDAIGRSVTQLGADLDAVLEEDRPGHVVVAIVTDGQENSSLDWTGDAVRALLTHQQEVYSWTVLFLGANIDAVATAASFGIPQEQSLTYVANAAGVSASIGTTSGLLRSVRATGKGAYDESDRDAAVGAP